MIPETVTITIVSPLVPALTHARNDEVNEERQNNFCFLRHANTGDMIYFDSEKLPADSSEIMMAPPSIFLDCPRRTGSLSTEVRLPRHGCMMQLQYEAWEFNSVLNKDTVTRGLLCSVRSI